MNSINEELTQRDPQFNQTVLSALPAELVPEFEINEWRTSPASPILQWIVEQIEFGEATLAIICASMLGDVQPEAVPTSLYARLELLLSAHNPTRELSACVALGNIQVASPNQNYSKSELAIRIIRRLRDADAPVRATAAFALAAIGLAHPDVFGVLDAVEAYDDSAEVRESARAAIQLIADQLAWDVDDPQVDPTDTNCEAVERATPACPHLFDIQAAANSGWEGSALQHVRRRCNYCSRMTALAWSVTAPSLSTVWRHLVDRTIPQKRHVEYFIDDLVLLGEIRAAAVISKVQEWYEGIVPVELRDAVLGFDPAKADAVSTGATRYIGEDLRYSSVLAEKTRRIFFEATRAMRFVVAIHGIETTSEPPTLIEVELKECRNSHLAGSQFIYDCAVKLPSDKQLKNLYGAGYHVKALLGGSKLTDTR